MSAMREHKYRAWDSEKMYTATLEDIILAMGHQCAEDVHLDEEIGEDLAGFAGYRRNENRRDVKIMEYLGYKDKNDVELCEGDRVRIGQREEGWIVYDQTKSAWIVQSYAYWCFVHEVDEIEVIGNLYETPVLVKGTESESEQAQ